MTLLLLTAASLALTVGATIFALLFRKQTRYRSTGQAASWADTLARGATASGMLDQIDRGGKLARALDNPVVNAKGDTQATIALKMFFTAIVGFVLFILAGLQVFTGGFTDWGFMPVIQSVALGIIGAGVGAAVQYGIPISRQAKHCARVVGGMASYQLLVARAISSGRTPPNALLTVTAYISNADIRGEHELLVRDVSNGTPLTVALDRFYARCPEPCVRNFTRLLSDMHSNGSQLVETLEHEAHQLREDAVRDLLTRGESTGPKMLGIITLMLLGAAAPFMISLFAGVDLSGLQGL